MPRLTRAESQAQTRALLLDAAADVFASRGFHGASVDDVADAAGYSKGAVYSNFASKDELFLALLHERVRREVELAERISAQASESPDQLARLLPDLDWPDLQWCQLVLEFWLYALRNPAAGARLAALEQQFRAGLAPVLAPLARDQMSPEELASVTIALYQGLSLQRHLDPEVVGVDLIARLLGALAGADKKDARVRA